MATYNKMNPVLGSSTIKLKFDSYIADSLDPVNTPNLWEQFFFKEDIPSVDPKTGRRWTKTFKVSKPQGPGGYAPYTEENFKGQQQPGYLGLMIPNDQEYTISTRFNYASIGRSYADQLSDENGFFEAVKNAEFADHIREQQIEEVKQEIFKQGIKTYAGSKTTEDDIASTDVLKWSDIDTLVDSISTYEVQLIDNRQRVANDFVNAVKAVSGTTTGASALEDLNVIDFKAFQDAQKAFETAGLRTYRWNAPRFNITGIESDNYNSTNINIADIKITAPEMKNLFTKKVSNSSSPMAVYVSANGYNQLWKDAEFLKLVEVSGYQNEQGLSGRFDKHIRSDKAVMVQGILIVNMEQDYMHGSLASNGVDFGKNKNSSDVELDAAVIATPGYNFITSSSDFGTRTTIKSLGQTDMIDRLGFHEFMYTMFTWDVQILTPSSFNLLIHAGKA